MLKYKKRKEYPVCPMCLQKGIHPTVDNCIAGLRREIGVLLQRIKA